MRATGRQPADDPRARRRRRQHDDRSAWRSSNGLVALSGALLAQYQGFADVQMGIGMVVWGLASVIIGEALVGTRQLGLRHHRRGDGLGAVPAAGRRSRCAPGSNPNDLKLITAAFVFVALVLPDAGRGRRRSGALMLEVARHREDVQRRARRTRSRAAGRRPDDRARARSSSSSARNGSGKSTLLNAVAGTFFVDSGTIRLAGRDITALARAPARAR